MIRFLALLLAGMVLLLVPGLWPLVLLCLGVGLALYLVRTYYLDYLDEPAPSRRSG